MSHPWWAGEQLKHNTMHKWNGEIMEISSGIKVWPQSYRTSQGFFFKSPENWSVSLKVWTLRKQNSWVTNVKVNHKDDSFLLESECCSKHFRYCFMLSYHNLTQKKITYQNKIKKKLNTQLYNWCKKVGMRMMSATCIPDTQGLLQQRHIEITSHWSW